MPDISATRAKELVSRFAGKRIAVIGDLMVDRYVWGKVARVSPEAPVPVVEVENETDRLGGAANVANNIRSLGAEPYLLGVVGRDATGERLKQLAVDQGCSTDGLIVDDDRPTTIKTRVIAHSQHVVRIDREEKREVSEEVQRRMLAGLESIAGRIDGIILEDYNKGVIARGLIGRVTALAHERNLTITVDPKLNNFFAYKDVTVFKPNKKETEEALGRLLQSDEDLRAAGEELLRRLNAQCVLLTRGEKGMTLFERDGSVLHVPTRARNVADVSGAGDTVIATLTLALVSGASIREGATLANHAAGVVCGEVGIVPIQPDPLLASVLS